MIPLSKSEIESFTPPSLSNVSPTPTFRFRPPSVRDQRRFTHALKAQGLRLHQNDSIRAEVLRVLEANWSPDVFEAERGRLETFWATADQGLPLDPEEQMAVVELIMRCQDVSPVLCRLEADNYRFGEEAPMVALGMFLLGWSNLETPFRREGGDVPMDLLDEIQNELTAIEDAAAAENVEGVTPGFAFAELYTHAIQLLSLDRGAEKNSPSPSPSPDTPNSSSTPNATAGGSENTSSVPKKTRGTASQSTTDS